jgi:anti-sigma B factor antagonist
LEDRTVIISPPPQESHFVVARASVRFLGGSVSLDDGKAEVVGERLCALADQLGPCTLLLDFSNVGYVSSALLGLLIRLHKRLGAAGGRLRLRNLSPRVYEVFEVTRLNTILDVRRALPSTGEPSELH